MAGAADVHGMGQSRAEMMHGSAPMWASDGANRFFLLGLRRLFVGCGPERGAPQMIPDGPPRRPWLRRLEMG